MNKRIVILLTIALLVLGLSGCGNNRIYDTGNESQITVVTTIFPAYDLARQIFAEDANIVLLVPPGSEIHSYEPTPRDIITIQNCDLFIYNGGESDEWVEDVIESVGEGVETFCLLDCVEAYEEEIKEGMMNLEEEEEEGEEPELDEHVWTSPVNMIKISELLAEKTCGMYPELSEKINTRAESFCSQLKGLDKEFKTVVKDSKFDVLIFADRFPARYFTEEYGLDYYAAYPGCAEQSEASAKTVAFLIDKVKENGITCVLYTEFSNQRMADVICEDTGCDKAIFNSCHNITKQQFDDGITYIDLMKNNLETLKRALN